ncbi:toprim domain-containing protein [Pseudoroseomonas aestuarii]
MVVEGYMDVIALHQAGFGGAVAPLGTALTEEQLAELWRMAPQPLLCFDGDKAGLRAAARAAELALPLLSPERSLGFVTLPAGEDPDTLVAKGGSGAFRTLLEAARPLSAVLYGMLAEKHPGGTPEARAALRHDLEDAAGKIPDKFLAGEYRRALLDSFFAGNRRPAPAPRQPWSPRGGAGGRGARPPAPALNLPRPGIDPAQVRQEQARCLLAITLAHPWLLGEVEEALASLELPEGMARRLQQAMLGWHGGTERLEAAALADHLEKMDPDGRPAAPVAAHAARGGEGSGPAAAGDAAMVVLLRPLPRRGGAAAGARGGGAGPCRHWQRGRADAADPAQRIARRPAPRRDGGGE